MVGPAVDAQSAVHRTVCQDSPQEMQLGKSLKGERENAAEGVQSCRVCVESRVWRHGSVCWIWIWTSGNQSLLPPLADAAPLRRRLRQQRLHGRPVQRHQQHLQALLRRGLSGRRLPDPALPSALRSSGSARPLAPAPPGDPGRGPGRIRPQLHRLLGEGRECRSRVVPGRLARSECVLGGHGLHSGHSFSPRLSVVRRGGGLHRLLLRGSGKPGLWEIRKSVLDHFSGSIRT